MMLRLFSFLFLLPACVQSAARPAYGNVPEDTVVHLSGVTVTARKIEWKSDGFVIHVPLSETKTADGILRQSPGVTLTDRDIMINGTGGVKVLVNDRELRLSGEDLLNYLKSVPGQSIGRVEVPSHADASMGADAGGGVVRLYLRKRLLEGLQANVSSRARLSRQVCEVVPSAFLSMKTGRVSFYSSLSHRMRPENKGYYVSERKYGNGKDRLTEDGDLSEPGHYSRCTLGMEWEMDSLNTLDADMEYTGDFSRKYTEGESYLSFGNLTVRNRSRFSQRDKSRMYSATADYRRMLDARGSWIKVMTDYVAKHVGNDHHYEYDDPQTRRDRTDQLLQNVDYEIVSEDISLKKVLLHESYLQAGLKYTCTEMRDFSLQTVLKYHERIGAGYVTAGFEKGRWRVNGGFRLECMRARGADGLIDERRLDLFPHLNVNCSFDDLKKLMLVVQYARTIDRPGFYEMNPERVQSSEYVYSVGNPTLKPAFGHQVNATLVYNYRYTFTAGANFYRDMIRPYSHHDAQNRLTDYVTYENHAHERHLFVAVTVPLDFGSLMRLTTNLVGVRQSIQKDGNDGNAAHYLVFADAVLQARINTQTAVELEYNMHSRLFTGNSQMGSLHVVNVSVRHKFLDGKLTVAAGIDNLLNQQNRYRVDLNSYLTDSQSNMAESGRVVKVTVAWNINEGKKVKEYRIEKSASEERDRLEATKKNYK